jgi:hypothetical protein
MKRSIFMAKGYNERKYELIDVVVIIAAAG